MQRLFGIRARFVHTVEGKRDDFYMIFHFDVNPTVIQTENMCVH